MTVEMILLEYAANDSISAFAITILKVLSSFKTCLASGFEEEKPLKWPVPSSLFEAWLCVCVNVCARFALEGTSCFSVRICFLREPKTLVLKSETKQKGEDGLGK